MLDSLKTLQKNSQFWTQVVAGGVMVWLFYNVSFLLPLILLPLGYAFSLMKRALQGKDDLPSWGDVGEHVVNGIFAFVLWLVFLLPALVLCIIAYSPSFTGVAGVAISKFLWLGFFMLACGGFSLFLMALARYAATGRFAAALEFGALISQIKTCLNEFVLLVLWCACTSTFLMSFAGTMAGWIPFGIVFLLLGSGWFLLWMVCSHATGSLYRRVFLENQPEPQPLPSPRDTLGAGVKKISLEDEDDAGLTRIRGDQDNNWA